MTTIKNMQGLAKDGTTIYAALKDAHSRLQQIKSDSRDPTPKEWDEVNRQVDSLQQLQS